MREGKASVPPRPEVICHMLSGLDARVDVDRWSETDGADRAVQISRYFEIEAGFRARCYIVGRVTMAPYAKGMAHDLGGAAPDRECHLASGCEARLAVVLDPGGKLHWETGDLDGDHLLMVLGPRVSDAHLRELVSRGVSYLVAPEERIDPAWLLDQLAQRFDASRVLVEGGGILNGVFLAAGLIDRISILMVPAIDGRSGAHNIFETGDDGVAGEMKLRLLSVEPEVHQMVHLTYEVSRDNAAH